MEKNFRLLKIILFIIGIYHIGLGIITFIPGEPAAFLAKNFFGMTFIVNTQILYIAKLLGIYAVAFGIMILVVMKDPRKYQILLNIAILVYTLRIINRIIFASEIQSAFQVSMLSMIIEIILLLFFGSAIFYLKPKKVLR